MANFVDHKLKRRLEVDPKAIYIPTRSQSTYIAYKRRGRSRNEDGKRPTFVKKKRFVLPESWFREACTVSTWLVMMVSYVIIIGVSIHLSNWHLNVKLMNYYYSVAGCNIWLQTCYYLLFFVWSLRIAEYLNGASGKCKLEAIGRRSLESVLFMAFIGFEIPCRYWLEYFHLLPFYEARN